MAEQVTALAALVDALASSLFILIGMVSCAAIGASTSKLLTILKGN